MILRGIRPHACQKHQAEAKQTVETLKRKLDGRRGLFASLVLSIKAPKSSASAPAANRCGTLLLRSGFTGG